MANLTLEEVHPSSLLSADENEPLEEHDDYAADLKVLLVACLVVDLLGSFLLVEITQVDTGHCSWTANHR